MLVLEVHRENGNGKRVVGVSLGNGLLCLSCHLCDMLDVIGNPFDVGFSLFGHKIGCKVDHHYGVPFVLIKTDTLEYIIWDIPEL